jgi:nucleoside-diphosphate-sugar epimerase
LVPQTILSLLKGEPALSGPGEQTRDLLHVEDVASAFVALLESDVQGPVNIGSGSPVTLRDVVSRIGKLMSAPELLKIGGRPGNPADPTTLIPCVARLQKEVGWQSTISIDAGLAQTIEYWKAHCLEER